MKKTLGGNRLGSGRKMQVDLHGYERSTHDLGYLWRSTMSSGTLVPFMSEIALPGDTFDINLNCDIKTHPTIGPLFGSYKVQLDVFQAPMRLYNALLHNNKLGIGLNMSQIKLPVITLTAPPVPAIVTTDTDFDNIQINPSSLPAYLGMRGVGFNGTDAPLTRNFNAVSILAYYEIYKQYYANKQEEIGAVIHTPISETIENITTITMIPDVGSGALLPQAPLSTSILVDASYKFEVDYTSPPWPFPNEDNIIINTMEHGQQSLKNLTISLIDDGLGTLTGYFNAGLWGTTHVLSWEYIGTSTPITTQPTVTTFPLSNIDEMREAILSSPSLIAPFNIDTPDLEPYNWLSLVSSGGIPQILSTQEGLAIKTYQSDLFNNWLQTEWIDGTNGITAVTAIDTSGGSFTLDTLNLSKKVYDMLNRIAVSGGTYDDWLDAVYTHDRYTRCETPMYMGGLIKELVFQEVVSNTQSGDQPLGTLAGKGILSKKHKGGHVICKVDEPSYIIGIISLTPRIDYSQGNKWDINLQTIDDLHKPALDEIGFQELIMEQAIWYSTYWDDTNDVWVQRSAGKQPAWINYMTNVNQTKGNFAMRDNEMFMTLNRRYEIDFIDDLTRDLTTYIDPAKFNFIFAETSIDAQNFWAQIAVDITARRKMSAKIMPNL